MITIQLLQNYLFVGISTYACIDTELCYQCYALPCECVYMGTVMKAGKGKLQHFKNLMKGHKVCLMICIHKVYHNDKS